MHARRIGAVLVLLVLLLGCGAPEVPMMTPLEATKPAEAFEGVQCSAVRPQTEPDLMAWDPGSRANLNRLRRKGVVAVRYVQQGCNVELELLSNCIGPGGDKAYEYAAYAASQSKVAHNATQLYAELPVGAARLAGKLKGDRVLRTDYTLVATAALPPEKTYKASDLQGADCARATHVISVVYLGGFAMVAGEARLLDASASVFLGGAQASTEAGVERVDSEGDAEACSAAKKERQENQLCAVPLRIGLVRLEGIAPPEAQSSNPGQRSAGAAPRRSGPPVTAYQQPTGAYEQPPASRPPARLVESNPLASLTARGELALHSPVIYATGSEHIDPASAPALAEVQRFLERSPQIALLRIEVHTDSDGSASANQSLSERRAWAVARYLAAAGVDCKRLVPVGFGSTRPVAPNTTPANKAMNRRTGFVVPSSTDPSGGGLVAGDPCRTP